jgi:hypothetical protein
MAIVFEQPQPFNAALYYQAARDDRSEGSDLRRQELALRQQQAVMEAQGDFARTAVAAGAQRANAGNMQFQSKLDMDRLQEGQRQFDIGEANEFAKQQQRAELQAWVGQQDMTYAEELRYQRDKNAVGFILADQTLTPWEKEELVLQRRTGIDMAEKRMQQTRQRQEELRNQEYQKQLDREAQTDGFLAKSGAQSAQSFVTDLGDGRKLIIKGFDARSRPQFEVVEPPKPPPAPKPVTPAQASQAAEAWLKENYPNEYAKWRKDPIENPLPTEIVQQRQAAFNRAMAGPAPEQSAPGQEQPPQQDQLDAKPIITKAIESMNAAAESLPEGVAAEVKSKLGRARGIAEAFGSLDAAPPELRREYETLMREVTDALIAAKRPGKKAPSKPVAGFGGSPANALGRIGG